MSNIGLLEQLGAAGESTSEGAALPGALDIGEAALSAGSRMSAVGVAEGRLPSRRGRTQPLVIRASSMMALPGAACESGSAAGEDHFSEDSKRALILQQCAADDVSN